jgi:hypothetical protein
MGLEDQVHFHEQMLRSIESNLAKVTDDLAQLTQLVHTMGGVMLTVAERHDRLEELFERWLRSQTNGQN